VIETYVGRDAEHPRFEASPSAIALKALKHSNQDVLEEVFGVGSMSDHPIQVSQQRPPKRFDQLRKRTVVPRTSALD